MRNCLCSAFKGKAKPLMILQKTHRRTEQLLWWMGEQKDKKKKKEETKTGQNKPGALRAEKKRPFKMHKNVLK